MVGSKKKIIKCLKCKKEINVDVDEKGIPYQKICHNCKNTYSKHGRGVTTAY